MSDEATEAIVMSHPANLMSLIDFDWRTLAEFRRLRTNAIRSGRMSFLFQKISVDVHYAKYVIEYLETKLSQ